VQLSLFAAALREPLVADLQGLLIGPGQAVRRGAAARISVVVDAQWRADALTVELTARGLVGETADAAGGHAVRTAFTEALAGLTARWMRGAVKAMPAGYRLDDPHLRLWALAAGEPCPGGWQLRLGPSDTELWPQAGAALAAAGLPGVFLAPHAGGPAYRFLRPRHVTRLLESIGDPPATAPRGAWG
jgi:hypothetical protein